MSDFINELKDLSGKETKILVTLLHLCSESQDFATYASNQKLSDISGVSLSGISGILKSLTEMGFVAAITKENGARKVYLDATRFCD